MPDGPVLLDTHVWLWYLLGHTALSEAAMRAIDQGRRRGNVLVSVMSVWEIGMLEAKGRIALGQPCDTWVERALGIGGITLAAFTPEIAIASSRLPGGPHGDPADRILIATARHAHATFLTRDVLILAYGDQGHLQTLPA